MASAGIHGHLVQVVDLAEETLPYAGRVEFQEMAGPLKFLSAKTETLRGAYAERLAAHRDALRDLCRRIGWTFTIHRTDESPARLLMMLHALISGRPAAMSFWSSLELHHAAGLGRLAAAAGHLVAAALHAAQARDGEVSAASACCSISSTARNSPTRRRGG